MAKKYLPRCVSKKELRNYWGVSRKYLREEIITDDLLEKLDIDIEKYNRLRNLTPDITKKIYLHFEIFDLNGDLSTELAA